VFLISDVKYLLKDVLLQLESW